MSAIETNKGSLLVEAVITVSIFLVVIIALFGSFSILLRGSLANIDKIQATYLEEEAMEAMRILRDNGWTANIASHTSGSTFYLYFNGTTWVATSSVEIIGDLFQRSIAISSVNRDSSQNIVASGGTLDNNTKLVTAQVSWVTQGTTSTSTLSTYITNVFNN
jgi:hypothetical protein